MDRDRDLPLSFSQQRLWFIHQMEPESPVYNISLSLWLEGALDGAELERALHEILRRHEVLRTRFHSVEGSPVQRLDPVKDRVLPLIILDALPPVMRERESLRLAEQEARRPFDLHSGPVFRASLARLSREDHVWLATVHHIACDAWSMELLWKELSALYEAYSSGRPSPLPDLPVQYADFAIWQRQLLEGDLLARELDYWTSRLGSEPPVLELPADRPRPAVQTFRGQRLEFSLPRAASWGLLELARRAGVSPFITGLAVFQALLRRYSGLWDISVGTPISGRSRVELESLIGFFLNTLVLRVDQPGDPSWLDLLRRVRELSLEAYAHQNVPFEKLVDELQPKRSLSHSPLFQVVFVLQHAAEGPQTLSGLRVKGIAPESVTSKFDLTLSMFTSTRDDLSGGIEYSSDLFDRTTIVRMAEHLARLMEGVVSNPESLVSCLPLLSDPERHQLSSEWNDPRQRPSNGMELHRLFELQVELRPDAVAVVCGSETLTYEELEARANRLAHRLLRLGIQPESVVAVCLERSQDLIVALLAAWKAGGVYLPLDPSYPEPRRSYMLQDSAAQVLITRRGFLGGLQAGAILCLDAADLSTESLDRPQVLAMPERLAYLIYTSGSTGEPKAVAVEHGPASTHLRNVAREYGLMPSDRNLQFAAPGFDVSLEQIGSTLSTGAILVLRRDEPWTAVEFPAYLVRHDITVANLPTAYWQLWVKEGEGFSFKLPLRLLIVGGEAMTPESTRLWSWRQDRCRPPLLNAYGPTEAVMTATLFPVSSGLEIAASAVPIGRPMSHRIAHVLDRLGHPLPLGVPGELHLGGLLARGYFGRPDLTAERFVPDAFAALSGQPGSRLYRSGDLARRRPSGEIEILGRLDHQVKIRGIRIELGEIEAALTRHPAVRQTVVLACEDSTGSKRLVAYVVAEAPGVMEKGSLRSYLQKHLPDYMVPSYFELLEAFPLTSNGKVDRRALPMPLSGRTGSGAVGPQSQVEGVLAAIWCDVLGLDQVGVEDDFFELGGHSLVAMRVLSQVRDAFGVELQVRDLFEAPVLEDLARRVEATLRVGEGRTLPPLVPLSRGGNLPLSFAQQRLWFLDQLEPGSPLYSLPAALRIAGPLQIAALAGSLAGVVERHEALRTVFRAVDGVPMQEISPTEGFLLPLVDLSGLPEAWRRQESLVLAGEEARRPFDLTHGPLLRAHLLHLGDADHVLLINMHHIVSDGWSVGILVREVVSIYGALLAGAIPRLPPLPLQYADFAGWQRQWLRGETLTHEIAYWRDQLAGAPPLLQLTTDRPRSAQQTSRGASLPLPGAATLSEGVRSLGRRQGTTPFMIWMAAFQGLLCRYTGQSDISVGTPVAGRNYTEIEGLIGFFVNTLVLRTDLSGDPSLRDLLARVREVSLLAHAHQDLPFEKLVEEMEPERRNPNHSPLFQVMLVLQNTPHEILAVHDLTLSGLDLPSASAKFELTLAVAETRGRFAAAMEYRTDLFDVTTVRRLGGHLEIFLRSMAEDPGQRLSSVSLLTPPERSQLLWEWNDTQTSPASGVCIHELFERQAQKTPDGVAVIFGDRRLTYDELNRAATQWACHLRELGVGPEVLVGVLIERSPEMLVVLLGVLKAGGAYVPLDAAYPGERLSFVLEDSGVAVLLTQQSLVAKLSTESIGHSVVCFVDSAPPAFPPRVTEPRATAVPDNLAYTIYTSGSTGRPKGVAIEHRSASAFLNWAGETFSGAELSGVLASTSISFDLSIFELFLPLVRGGSVVLVQDALSLCGEEAGFEVTLVNTVPSAMQEVVNRGGLPPSIRTVNLAGEALRLSLVDQIYGSGSARRVLNLYGPSEDTTYSTFAQLDRGSGREPGIGRPIANKVVYLLDHQLQLVPVGVPGELHIGGKGLARGYLNRSELTAERFVPDGFSEGRGARLYRTGDLARWLPSGELEFLGRLDHQVKVRGFRVELGEIEAVLTRHPAIAFVAVLARADATGDRRLVAFVVMAAGIQATAGELRGFLRRELPEYMVPSAWVSLEAMPLTSSGKVNRQALAAMEALVRPESSYVKPRSPIEEVLAAIWSDVLGLDRVGVEEDFFELGGHSLLAMRVHSRLRDAFRLDLSVRDLFDAPTVAGLAERVVRSLRQGEAVAVPAILPVGRDRDLPLSFAQQRLWFIDQLEPESPIYNIPLHLRIEGALEPALLERSWREVIRRHEVLRTRFEAVAGSPVQRIDPVPDRVLAVIDLAALPASLRDRELRSLSQQEAERPFDLGHGPVLRASLARLGAAEHVLLATVHHIASDAWSMEILWREISALYAAFGDGRPSPLAELPVQYVDFASWQRECLARDLLAGQLAYWKSRLGGEPPVLELPTDRPRPAVQTFRGARLAFSLPEGPSQALQALARREGVSLFMAMLSVFQVLLRRYSGQWDVSVGTPISGRNRLELEGLIGFFLNTLVVRLDLRGDPSWRDLLRRMRDLSLEAYAHQDVPFENLVDDLQPRRSLSHSPLFQVMFVLLHEPARHGELPGLRLTWAHPEATTSKFDLTLQLLARETGRLSGWIEFNTDLFDWATMVRMAEHLSCLAEGIVSDPEATVSSLALLGSAERHQLLWEWNDSVQVFPPAEGLYGLFARQAARTPDAEAVVYARERLSYAELDRRAGEVARRLRALGVGPEVRVGLAVERSLDMAVGVLGLFKSGGVCVPLDPAYPHERRSLMLRDAGVQALLTQESLLAELSAESLPSLCLERLDFWDDPGEETSAEAVVSADNLAYVIYTSGSTGVPKGVALSHGALCNLMDWHLTVLLGGVRTLQFASLSFDASFHEMFACWASGGTLVMVDEATRRDAAGLASLLVEERIEKAIFPVVLWQQLCEEYGRWELLPPLREVTTTGEQLQTTRAMAALLERLEDCALHNHYGPSESHVVTAYTLSSQPEQWSTHPSIGLPIGNSEVHLLDEQMGVVPVGVAGELYIGGMCLARGYLGRPELTAGRFVPNPFSPEPGARLYRTGDKVRRLSDGNLDFLGRFDHQVKVRGFRVELEEIESVLGRHPSVRQTVVLAREDSVGSKRLVAYVVAEAPGVIEMGSLRSYLQEHLPDYMVPSHFVLLESFPLTSNGKVDRRALPMPSSERAEAGYVAPRTEVEGVLAAIWSDVLGLDRVGVEDDFFELGGHSLLATQVLSRLRSAFRVELQVRDLFEASVLSGLAGRVEAALRAGRGLGAPPLVLVPRQGDLPLSFAQQRLWFLDQLEPESPMYNLPVALRVTGPLQVSPLAASLSEVVRRHEVLRTVIQTVEGVPSQRILPAALFPLAIVDLSDLSADRSRQVALLLAVEEARRPFDLARGPLLRGCLVRLGEADHAVLITMHHIASDGWSMEILVHELETLYEAFARRHPSPLPELPIQYADFAVWQRRWLRGETLEAEISYWRHRLAGAPAVLDLALERPRPAIQSFCGASEPLRLSVELVRCLRELSRREGISLFMTLLAGFQTLLSRYTRQEDICLGTPIAGRTRMEIENLIGFFVNTLVLRTDLSGSPGFRDLLHRVREVALEAYLHQEVPFEKIVEELEPQRSLSHTPLFQVMFGLRNVPRRELAVTGLQTEPLGGGSETSKFDLTLSLIELDAEIHGSLVYNIDLFSAVTARRMLSHLRELLAGAVQTPDLRVSELPLLTQHERQQLLVDFNDSQSGFRRLGCVHHLFERQVLLTPEQPAVVSEQVSLTFAELNRRANRLARHLCSLGTQSERLVALALERSADMIVALLAVLKAGGAYVPLDLHQPGERLASILAESRTSLLLTREGLLQDLPTSSALAEVVCLDRDWPGIEGWSAENLPARALPENLAYVIFTSGSTGQPKGVAVEHRQLVHYVSGILQRLDLPSGSHYATVSTLAADLGNTSIFASLCSGGCLHILSEDRATDPRAMAEYMDRHPIDCLKIVPSHLEALGNGVPLEKLLPRQRLVLGGEPSRSEWIAELLGAARCTVLNHYGPTETTVGVMTYRVGAAVDLRSAAMLPIGRPLPDSRVYLLNDGLQPVPFLALGELYVAGEGLARGYLHSPDLTAEKFVPNPFSSEPGARLYRTGDLARRSTAGSVEFRGRADHQVKLSGFRVELGETEAILNRHPAVAQGIVLAQESEGGGKRLVAYVVPSPGEEISPRELRTFLNESLPAYMVPASFVRLDALPLTANGKIDRRALARLGPSLESGRKDLVLPRSRIEEVLADIWREILNLEGIGVQESFFELGGHSLLAVRLMARIERRFGRMLPLATLFKAPTIESLARILGEENDLPRRSPLVVLESRGEISPIFFVHPIGGHVFCYLDLARSLGSDQPFYAFQSPDPDSAEAVPDRVEHMATRYLNELRQVQPEGPYRLGGWSMGGLVAFEMARQLESEGQAVELVVLIDTQPPGSVDRRHADEADRVAWFAQDLASRLGIRAWVSAEQLRAVSGDKLAWLSEQAHCSGLLPDHLGMAAVRRLYEVFSTNLRAADRYRPEACSSALALWLPEEAAERPWDAVSEWGALSRRELDVHYLPGDHATLVRPPYVHHLAAQLKTLLLKRR